MGQSRMKIEIDQFRLEFSRINP